jgi:site-specific DNA-methyltransferase (adenine-specific)
MTEPYYRDDLATIYHGDCLDVLPTLSGVDLVVTSPPYNLGAGIGSFPTRGGMWDKAQHEIGRGYDTHDDAMQLDAYVTWQRAVLTAAWATLTDTGAIMYNHKPRPQAGELWLPLACNPDLPLRQIIIWARTGGLNFATTHYLPTHEWLMVFARPNWRILPGKSGVGDVWRIPAASNPDHPAPFPIGIPARAIDTTAPTLVLDPFAGSGTTLRAASDAGVRSIGIELSERYCEIAARRLSQGALELWGG